MTWTSSTSTNVSGYNVYRSTTSSGPYAKLNSSLLAGGSYTDSSIQSGQTYYYVSTAVDNTGAESAYSNQSQAIVPNP
jgi:fibronectin type 3 domain-containing protein